MTNLLIPPRGYVDLLVQEGDVGRVLSCGNGRGVVVFERGTFAGEYEDGNLDTCATTTYAYPPYDACDWKSTQRIRGPLDRLELTYTESPVRGHPCAFPCPATATVERVP